MKEKVFVSLEPLAFFALAGSPFGCSGVSEDDTLDLSGVELAVSTPCTKAATVLNTVGLCGNDECVSGRFVAAIHRVSPP